MVRRSGGVGGPRAPPYNQASNRRPVSNDIFTGEVIEWRAHWGWAFPNEPINHPMVRKNNGRIFIHGADARSPDEAQAVAVGCHVEFSLYADSKGLGAEEWAVLDEGGGEAPAPQTRRGYWVQRHTQQAEEGADYSAQDEEAGAEGDPPQPEGNEEPLPEGWEMVWSADHGEWYFWHGDSKTSAWTRPTGPPTIDGAEAEQASSKGGAAAGNEAGSDAAPPQKRSRTGKATGKTAGKAAGKEAPKASTKADDKAPLPEGWEEHFDPQHGEVYYWHPQSETTTWERPVGQPNDQEEHTTGPGRPAADAGGQLLSRHRIKGRIAKWQGTSGFAVPAQDVDDSLIPVLEQSEYRITVTASDVQDGQRLITGSKVDFLLYNDDSGLSAIEVRLLQAPTPPSGENGSAGKGKGAAASSAKAGAEALGACCTKGSKGLGKQQQQQQQEAATDGAEDNGEAPLLPGWEQVWDQENQAFYFWHAASRQSSWERPAVGGDSPAVEDGVEEEGAEYVEDVEGEDAEEVEATDASIPSGDATDKQQVMPRPQGTVGGAKIPASPKAAAQALKRQRKW